MDQQPVMSRRDIVRLGVGVVACPLVAACAGDAPTESSATPPGPDDAVRVIGNTITVDVTRVPVFATAGASGEVAVIFLGARLIVVRRSATEYRALSNVCPHSGCGVSVVNTPRLVCPCHGSEFDFTGRRLEGPAPTGLPELAATFDAAAQRLRIERPAG